MKYQDIGAYMVRFTLFSHCSHALLLLPLLATASYAQSQDDMADIERITTTASRAASDTQALPLIVSSVSEQALLMSAPTHIEEALKWVAGANLQRGNGQEYLPALRSPVFSGAGACGGLLTAEDGIPLRAAGFCNINELFEAHSEMAQRIEVLKGPGSVFYGSNAVHGVINVITPDTTQGGGMAGADWGSFGYSRYKLRAGKDNGNNGFGLNASVTRDNGYRDEEGVDQEKLNLRHRYNVGDVTLTTGLTYTHLDQQTAGYITGFESYKDKDIAQGNDNPEAFRKARSLRLWSRFDWQPDAHNSVMVTPYYRNQSMDFLMHFLPGTPMEENAQHGVGVQSLWQHRVSDTLQVSVGLDGERTSGDLLEYQDNPTEGSAFLVATVPAGKHYDYTVEATQLAPFIQLQWQQHDWTVTAGLRHESMEYDYTNHMVDGRTREDGTTCGFGGCRYTRPPSGENSFSNTSPKLGISYRYSDYTHFYANLSKGYRAPQATELYRLQRDQSVADLQSETARNIEVGVKSVYSALQYSVALYRMDKDNFIFRDANFFNVNDGQSRHQGIELELAWRFDPHWDVAVAATHASHTYSYDEILSDININGNDMDTAPRTVGNVRLGWQPLTTMRAELEWAHMSRYYTDPENLHEYAGHDILSLRGSWEVNDAMQVTARINNLLDTAYAERADYTSFGGDRYFPGRPRNLSVSLNYQW